jgi:hypothetical protein
LNRINRRTLAPVALLSLALLSLGLLAAAPVAAAEPEGVLLDGTATVTVVEPGGGPAVPNAEVTLRAYQTDFPEDPDLALMTGTTDAAGQVTFTDVPYPDAGGPAVYVDVDAYREVETTDDEGCVIFQSWHGHVDGLTSMATASIEVVADPASSIRCHTLAGTILDAGGNPVPPAFAFVSIELPDGGGAQGYPLQVGDDGSFIQRLPNWGTFEDPAIVSVQFLSAPTRVEEDGECVLSFAERAEWSGLFALADGEEVPFLELVTEEVEIGSACGTEGPGGGEEPGTEAPGGGAAPTLPPTDTLATAPGAGTSGAGETLPVGGVMVAIGLLLLGSANTMRLSARRAK